MRAINHAVTGAVIGLAVGNPWVAVPAALASHFVLDAIPHHGFKDEGHELSSFNRALVTDGLLCFCLVVVLALWQPDNWQLAAACAFFAASPDFMWVSRYLRERRHQKPRKPRGIVYFHHIIQWFQRPIGWVVEVAWFGAAAWLLYLVGTALTP